MVFIEPGLVAVWSVGGPAGDVASVGMFRKGSTELHNALTSVQHQGREPYATTDEQLVGKPSTTKPGGGTDGREGTTFATRAGTLQRV
jgi:hypothetical protein